MEHITHSLSAMVVTQRVAAYGSAADHPCDASDNAGVKDQDKQRLAGQLVQLDEAYPGGLLQYVRNARQLLQDSRKGVLSRTVRMAHAKCRSMSRTCSNGQPVCMLHIASSCGPDDVATNRTQGRTHLMGMCPACPRGRSWTTAATAATSWRRWVCGPYAMAHDGINVALGDARLRSTNTGASSQHCGCLLHIIVLPI